MTASNGINYRETYFEYPELAKVHGEPDSESLYKLRNELKANAQSVYSNLSDGAHGHLALVLSDAQFALLTNQPFVRPNHPGTLIIPANTTGPMATTMKEEHHEQIRLFREVQGVEKALVQQIVQAIEAPYLAAIRDRNSNSLMGTVHEILEHLQTVYGRVSPQMLENREQELRNMTYNTKYPIDVVFNAVEDYVDFAELGQQPLTQRQTIAKAYVILNKTRRFRNDITEWNRLPENGKKWVNFKDHFRRAHQEFRETTDVTLEESELQRNNANLVQQVVDGIQQSMPSTEHQKTDSQQENLLPFFLKWPTRPLAILKRNSSF
jgi:Sec-independent protein translocase protein TatA